jgi:choice-of-anchor A domain-containing protein
MGCGGRSGLDDQTLNANVGGSGGTTAEGGNMATGGYLANGGMMHMGASGGSIHAGGSSPIGGKVSRGGTVPTGETANTGGAMPTGGNATTGGMPQTGGNSGGNTMSTGGYTATGGTMNIGGMSPTGGASSTMMLCCDMAPQCNAGDVEQSSYQCADAGQCYKVQVCCSTVLCAKGTGTNGSCFISDLVDVNLYVKKDAVPAGGDTQGMLYVGGNLIADTYVVGEKLTLDCTQYSLVVGGNLSISAGSVQGGKAVFAGSTASVANVGFDCGGLQRQKLVDFVTLEAEVNDTSAMLSTLPTNGTVNDYDSVADVQVLSGADRRRNVFRIDASQLVHNVEVDFPLGSTAVINVSGTSVNWTDLEVCLNGNCTDDFESGFVIWNFYEATSLFLSGIAVQGTVLAPLATLDGGPGSISGSVIVQYLKGVLEYYPHPFIGCIRQPTSG